MASHLTNNSSHFPAAHRVSDSDALNGHAYYRRHCAAWNAFFLLDDPCGQDDAQGSRAGAALRKAALSLNVFSYLPFLPPS